MQFIDVIGPLSQDFHLVIPSMPGIGFAIPLSGPGWNIGKTADAYTELMPRLCYDRYDVQGSGGGAYIGPEIGRLAPERVIGVHVNVLVTFPSGNPADFADLIEDEQERLARLQHFRDDMLTTVSIYWLTGTSGSSVNLYY